MKSFYLLTVGLLVLLMQGCGGGSSDDGGDTSAASSLSGTAATGAAIVGQVKITGSKGSTVTVTIDAAGNYQADVATLTAPFIITATPTDTNKATQYSFAVKGNVVANITPLTTLALFEANGKGDLNTLIASWPALFNSISQSSIDAQKAIINANFQTFMTSNGIDSTSFDVFSSVFNADSNGFDAVLDLITFSVDFSNGSITITIPSAPSFSFDANINGSGGSGGGSSGATAAGALGLAGNGATILGFSSIDLVTYPSQTTSTTTGIIQGDTITWHKVDGTVEYTLTVNRSSVSGTQTVLNATFSKADSGSPIGFWSSSAIDTAIDIQAGQVVFTNVSMDSSGATNDLIISGTLLR